MQQRFGFALLLGLGAARALDVRARAIVVAIEEQDARPQVDGLVVVVGEVVVEAGEQELLDPRVPLCAA